MRLLSCAFFAVMLAFVAASCGRKTETLELKSGHADSLIFDAGTVRNYARMLELADSFEHTGNITQLNANRWRGVAYYRQNQYKTAEYYYKKALACDIKTSQDSLAYVKSARRLSEILLVKGDYEGSLKVAMPAVAKLKETGYGTDIDYAILLNNIGCCQLNLGRGEEAQESFGAARQYYTNRWTSDSTGRGFQEAVIGTVYTSQAYINTKRFDEAIYWIDRTEMLLEKYDEIPGAQRDYSDEYKGRIEIMRAVAMQGLGQEDNASKAYKAFCATNYAKTSSGLILAADFLMVAKRYNEAADNYMQLDKMLGEWGIDLTLDNIQLYLMPKLRANVESLRKDSAMAVGLQLCNALDSAIINGKNDEAAELATIYETQQKETQIALQQADMDSQRFWGTLVVLALVVIFFTIFIFWHHHAALRVRHAHERLAEAHTKLQTAYDQLEETTAVKERIESELRIARDIQMSMVPQQFPEREDLDIHATMSTAKEVGGDLYSYILEGDMLYFCVADVSGKGVPASLFMAQAIRLFRTFATQRMMPADIVTHMNAALTEDNEQGMFVTMFLGLIDLTTGNLKFCNAGHNPPVLIENIETEQRTVRFLEMIPNAPIGLWPDLEYEGEEIESIKNCPLVTYTDGLTEAENRQQEQFGEERLLDMMRNNRFGCAKEVDDFLTGEVERFRDGAEPNDDLTIMTLKVE